MQIPAAGFIEGAKDQIDSPSDKLAHVMMLERNELREAIGASSVDMQYGYLLGLQTARQMLATSTTLILAKIDPDDIL
jgi:hypothetical protein